MYETNGIVSKRTLFNSSFSMIKHASLPGIRYSRNEKLLTV
ncbi:hypothetical protein M2298_002005 [Brevibacillus sp. 1238]|nr:hypothetical protein [Brevibacillus sp. 1238]